MKVTMVSVVLFAFGLLSMSASSVDGATGPATKCAPGYTPSVTACKAPITAGAPLSGTGPCCSCPFGSYNTDGNTCKRCSSPTATVSGVDVSKWGSQCSCLPGFGDYDPVAQTCRQCPVNTYSLNNKCVPCAAGAFAPAQSSTCAPVTCPASSYLPPGGSTVADCVRCKFGTVGTACSTVQACGCAPGFATFDKTAGSCQACAANSIAVYADAKLTDATNTVCWPCPVGTIASADGRTCAAPASTTPNTALVAASTIPANPIPSTTCATVPVEGGCTNGYDITATISKTSGGAITTSTAFVSHSADFFRSSTTYSNAVLTGSLASGTNIFFTDETGTIQGTLMTDSSTGTLRLTTIQSPNAINFYGITCASLASNFNRQEPCIKLTSGSAVSIKSLIPAGILTADGSGNTWDLLVQLTCASSKTLVSAGCTVGNSGLEIMDGLGDSWVSLNGGGAKTALGTVSGDGSTKFGTKVIAFYDDSNTQNIQYVLAAPPANQASNKNVYLDGTTALTGKPCSVGGNIAACVPMNVHSTALDAIMNYVSAGAANHVVSVVSGCPASTA